MSNSVITGVLATIVLADFVEYHADGSVDVDRTNQKWADNLSLFITQSEIDNTTVAAAVDSVFDTYRGQSIPMPTLTMFALQHLGANPANSQYLTKRVQEFVRANSQGERTNGVWERPNSTYVIAKGQGGGAFRRADCPDRIKKMEEAAEKAAKTAAKSATKTAKQS